jgi:tricorn protease
MYWETWPIERDFLYDPAAHGLDLQAAEKKYQPYLSGLDHRQDLSLLMEVMLGELCLLDTATQTRKMVNSKQ